MYRATTPCQGACFNNNLGLFDTINLEPALLDVSFHSYGQIEIYVRTLSKGQWAYHYYDTNNEFREGFNHRYKEALYLNNLPNANGVFFLHDDCVEQIFLPKLPNELLCDCRPDCSHIYSINVTTKFDCFDGIRNFSTTIIPLSTDDRRTIELKDENFLLQSIADVQSGTFTSSNVVYYLNITSGNYVFRQDYRDPSSPYEIPKDYHASLLFNYDKSSDRFGDFIRLRNYSKGKYNKYKCKNVPQNITELETRTAFHGASDLLKLSKDDEYYSPYDYKLFNLDPSVDNPILLFVRIDYKTNRLVIIVCDYNRCLDDAVGIPDYSGMFQYLRASKHDLRQTTTWTDEFHGLLRIIKNPGDEPFISISFHRKQSIFIPFRILDDNKGIDILVNSSYVCSGNPTFMDYWFASGKKCTNKNQTISDSDRRNYSYQCEYSSRFHGARRSTDINFGNRCFEYMWRYSYGNKTGCDLVHLSHEKKVKCLDPMKILVVSKNSCANDTGIIKCGYQHSNATYPWNLGKLQCGGAHYNTTTPGNTSSPGSLIAMYGLIAISGFALLIWIAIAIYRMCKMCGGFCNLRSAFHSTDHSNDRSIGSRITGLCKTLRWSRSTEDTIHLLDSETGHKYYDSCDDKHRVIGMHVTDVKVEDIMVQEKFK